MLLSLHWPGVRGKKIKATYWYYAKWAYCAAAVVGASSALTYSPYDVDEDATRDVNQALESRDFDGFEDFSCPTLDIQGQILAGQYCDNIERGLEESEELERRNPESVTQLWLKGQPYFTVGKPFCAGRGIYQYDLNRKLTVLINACRTVWGEQGECVYGSPGHPKCQWTKR